MKQTKLLFGLSLAFIASCYLAGCQLGSADVTNQIKEANKAFMEAFNNGDAHAVALNYTDDAKLLPAKSDVVEGQEAIETFWKGAIGMGVAKAELETVEAKASGNMAVEEGRYQLFTKDGQMIDHGKYVVNWEKVGGVWKLQKDIWNTNIGDNPIVGAWNIFEMSGMSNGSAFNMTADNTNGKQLKMWTNSHFSFVGKSGSNYNYGGGTYSLDGNKYEEYIEYHVGPSYVGTTVKMLLKIKGDTLIQTYPVDAEGNIDKNNYSVEKYVRLD